jgi:hypothetical protein
LGIGEELLTALLARLDPIQTTQVLLDLPTGSESFSRVLHRGGFLPYMTRYSLALRSSGNGG